MMNTTADIFKFHSFFLWDLMLLFTFSLFFYIQLCFPLNLVYLSPISCTEFSNCINWGQLSNEFVVAKKNIYPSSSNILLFSVKLMINCHDYCILFYKNCQTDVTATSAWKRYSAKLRQITTFSCSKWQQFTRFDTFPLLFCTR